MDESGTAALLAVKEQAPAATAGESASLMEMFREAEAAEQGATASDEAPANDDGPGNDNGKAKPERGEDGKFKKAAADEKSEKPAKPKGTEIAEDLTVPGLVKARRALRTKEAALEARMAEREAAAEAKAAHLQSLVDELERGAQKNVKKLAEAGDMDGVAQALGFRDWNHVNEHHARMLASPEYRRIRALEEERAAEKKQREEWQRQQEAQQAEAERQQLVSEAISDISEALGKHENPKIVKLATDIKYIDRVYSVIDEVYRNGLGQRGKPGYIPPGTVMETNDAASIVEGFAQQQYSFLHSVYGEDSHGGQPTSQAETRSRVSQNRAVGNPPERKASKHVSTNTATEASEPAPKNMSDAQWKEWALKELKKPEAQAAE